MMMQRSGAKTSPLHRRTACLLVVAMMALFHRPTLVSADPQGITVTSVRGAVEYRAGNGAWTPLSSSGTTLSGSPVLKTGANGEAVIQLAPGSLLRVSPNSTVGLTAPPAGFVPLTNGPSAISLDLTGRTYANSLQQPLSFKTRAAVLDTSGAEFTVDAKKDRTVVRVVQGYVTVQGDVVYLDYLHQKKYGKQMLVGPGLTVIAVMSNAVPAAALVGGGVVAGGAAAALAGSAGSGAAPSASSLSTQSQAASQADASR